ncbi:prefoldin subunit alpha [Candidatus Woesearchaeota archaeon]|nr:prefoldin subunit alpha [Candidatus Woesearchaeota archaeon]
MKDKEKRFQEIYIEFQVLSNTIQQLEKQSVALENHLLELMATKQSLDDMEKIKPGAEILVPLSAGIYAKASLKESDKFIVNVGSNIALSKSPASTKNIIEDQVNEIKKLQENLSQELGISTAKAAELEEELNKIASSLQDK